MRGDDEPSGHLFSYVSPDQRVTADHPLRAIRRMTDAALRDLRPALRSPRRPPSRASREASDGCGRSCSTWRGLRPPWLSLFFEKAFVRRLEP